MGAEDLTVPGHIFPLRAMDGGVLRRAGHTEAAVDLARMAGCYPAGVICEVLDEQGDMARLPQLTDLARRHGLKMITIKDLIEYRTRKESLVRRIAIHPAAHGIRRVHGRRLRGHGGRAASIWLSSWARWPARPRCSCACTPSA